MPIEPRAGRGSARRPWLILGLATSLALAGCAPRPAPHLATAPALEDTLGLARGLREPLAEWAGWWRAADPDFQLSQLRWGPIDSIQVSREWPDSTPLNREREPRLEVSPDGRHAIDPNLYATWNAEEGHWMYDADAAVVLFDADARLARILAFCGTSCRYETAVWLDDHTFAVTGFFEEELVEADGEVRRLAPSVDIYDLVSGRVRYAYGPPIPFPRLEFYDIARDSATRAAPAQIARRLLEAPPHVGRTSLARFDARSILELQHQHAILAAVRLDRIHVDERTAVHAHELTAR